MRTTRMVRITVATSGRRVELAVPEGSSLASVLPGLLGAGEHVSEQGLLTGDWTIHRADGTTLEPDRTLAAQQVAEGEELSLLPTKTDWPEQETEEPSHKPSAGQARQVVVPAQRGQWSPRHTEWTGLAVGAGMILLCLFGVVRSGWPGQYPAWSAFGLAGLALAIGVVLTRGLRDTTAGGLYATVALLCAAVGGGLWWPGNWSLGAGSAVLAVAVAGLLAAAGRIAVLAAGATAGLLALAAAGLTAWVGLAGPKACAVIALAGLAVSPALESWSWKLGRLPLPVPPTARSAISAPVLRADGVHTGMIVGIAVVVGRCELVLIRGGDAAALILVATLTVGFTLRARTQRKVARRLAWLAVAGCGAACLVAGPLLTGRPGVLSVAGPVLVGLAALTVVAYLQYRLRKPESRRGRYDLLEAFSLLAVVPAACAVLGLYGS